MFVSYTDLNWTRSMPRYRQLISKTFTVDDMSCLYSGASLFFSLRHVCHLSLALGKYIFVYINLSAYRLISESAHSGLVFGLCISSHSSETIERKRSPLRRLAGVVTMLSRGKAARSWIGAAEQLSKWIRGDGDCSSRQPAGVWCSAVSVRRIRMSTWTS